MGSGKHSSRKRSSPSSSALKARKKKKKRSKDRRKKRSRRDQDKSKRHYSDDDSTSISSVAHSISDDDHCTKRRCRSLATRDTKAHKRRADRSPSSSESSEDTRRRRKSKRRKDTDSRRKSKRHDKKRRREPSVDSVSSPSRSCSTCGSRDDNAVRNSKTKVRPHKPKQDEKDMGKERSKNNYRSRSCSLSSHRDSENERAESEKIETIENQPKRLKSVVIVADERYRDEDRDDIKDEMVYENDDYPSCRSNDSNDGAGAKDAADHSITDKFINIEYAREEKGASDVFTSTSPGSSGLPGGGLGDEAPSSSRRDEVSDLLKGNMDETRTSNDAGPKVDDLEAILRQKALENLKEFRDRAKIDRDEKDNHDGKLKELPRLSTESMLERPDKERGAVFATSASLSEDVGSLTMGKSLDVSTHKTGADLDATANMGTEFRAVKRDSSQIPSRKESAHEPLPDTAHPSSRKNFDQRHPNRIIHLSSKRPVTTNPWEGNTIHDNAKNQRNLLTSTPNQEPSEPNRTLEEASALRDSSHQRVPNSLKRALTDAAKSTHSVSQGSKLAVPEGTSSTEAPTTNQNDAVQTANDEQKQISKDEQKQATKDEQKEGDGSSQFQQKTMSVMQGGELVQVNYKVYIPKNAPALARRKLKR